ncbi:MAG: transglutaminase-like domain-containing protein [Pirellulaceae bacterium]|nr:transglutaminase-like domain-containing protein [Pirellulaceae bacterium]
MRPPLTRREFIAASGSTLVVGNLLAADHSRSEFFPPAYSIIPVVADGKWIWNKPPPETGYLEPREFDVRVGIQMEGRGATNQIVATTPAPVDFPEQRITDTKIDRVGCQATLRKVDEGAGQLLMAAPSLVKGRTIRAVATFRATLYKQHHGFAAQQFPQKQTVTRAARDQFLGISPGIQTSDKQVRQLAQQLQTDHTHPWEFAHACYQWVWEHIRARHGKYTSVSAALRDRVGDCEERASTFVALCRSVGIPARVVWVPNHNWAEFLLTDKAGKAHWIPAHTAAYPWFGWTGAHELVLQKGDRIQVPEKRKRQRLLSDWMQWQGVRPQVTYIGELIPVAEKDADPGPGRRRKEENGRWDLLATHPLDAKLRDGRRARITPTRVEQ